MVETNTFTLGTQGVFRHIGLGSALPKTLATGLRIDGKAIAPRENETVTDTVAVKSVAETPSVAEMFRQGMTERLTQNAKDLNLSENVALQLKSSLISTASEISKQFGVVNAEKFMNQVLYATQEKVTEEGITGAVSQFFKELVFNGGDEVDFPQKLEKVLGFMNQGLDILTEENSPGPASTGLSYALNVYFGKSKDPKEKEVFEFTAYFDWSAIKDPEEVSPMEGLEGTGLEGTGIEGSGPENGEKSGDYVNSPTLTAQFIETVTLTENESRNAANWLKENQGAYTAADYLVQNASNPTLDDFNVALAIVAQENGQEALNDFANYLNENVAPYAKAGDFTFNGWSLGLDYSQPIDLAESGRLALGTIDPHNGQVGYAEDQKLKDSGHQGVLLNFTYPDPKTGTKAVYAKTCDLTELFENYLSTRKVDVLV
jgi:hypothetical protein